MKFKNWEDYHHQIYRIYHGIIALSLVPFFLVFLELEVASIKEPRVSSLWIYLILFVLIPICIFLMWRVWKVEKSESENTDFQLREKLIFFRKIEVRKYLELELACILGLVGLWLTAHYLFVIIYFAVLAQFSFLRPSEDRFVRNMRLTKAERKQLHEETI